MQIFCASRLVQVFVQVSWASVMDINSAKQTRTAYVSHMRIRLVYPWPGRWRSLEFGTVKASSRTADLLICYNTFTRVVSVCGRV